MNFRQKFNRCRLKVIRKSGDILAIMYLDNPTLQFRTHRAYYYAACLIINNAGQEKADGPQRSSAPISTA